MSPNDARRPRSLARSAVVWAFLFSCGGAPVATRTVIVPAREPTAAVSTAPPPYAPAASNVAPPPPRAYPLQVSAGGEVSCATMSDTTVECWGNNQFDQVGLGAERDQKRPRQVPHLTGVARVSVGDAFVCALMLDTTVQCWGSNYYGALGLGDEAARVEPTPIPGLRDVTQVAAGWAACALIKDGTVTCWGDWDPGSGDPRSIGAKSPVKVLAVRDAVEVAVGRSHSCARGPTGAVTCWRLVSPGLVPRGKVRADPVAIRLADAAGLSLGSYGAAVTKTGQVKCWGGCAFDLPGYSGGDYTLATTVPGISHAVEVATSDDVACVRQDDGAVRCGGKAGVAALPNVARAVQLAAGESHACALLDNHAVTCWGENGVGQLGDGTTDKRSGPVFVAF